MTVRFLYDHAQVYWLDLWTWNGRYVLYSGDRYCELDATEWQNVIEGDPSVIYGKPILYRMPLLPTLLVVFVVGAVVRRSFFRTEQKNSKTSWMTSVIREPYRFFFDTDNHGELFDSLRSNCCGLLAAPPILVRSERTASSRPFWIPPA